jgi:hypothetical protein
LVTSRSRRDARDHCFSIEASDKEPLNADIGCVVTNHSYTKAAKTLARSLSVLLIHHEDLPKLDKIVFESLGDA